MSDEQAQLKEVSDEVDKIVAETMTKKKAAVPAAEVFLVYMTKLILLDSYFYIILMFRLLMSKVCLTLK